MILLAEKEESRNESLGGGAGIRASQTRRTPPLARRHPFNQAAPLWVNKAVCFVEIRPSPDSGNARCLSITMPDMLEQNT